MGKRIKSAALTRLVERNLSEQSKNSHGELKRRKLTKAVKKARQRKREEAGKSLNTEGHSTKHSNINTDSMQNKSAEVTEIENLKKEIAKELGTHATYIKRQRRDEVPNSWAGLTPGLAPVGYNPDESDSDDDPY